MKKLFILGLVLAVFTLSPSALAQQSINNDGVTGSDLQPQGQVRQNSASASSQQTQDVANEVANSSVLETTQVQNLEVTGAPADSQLEETQTTYRWIVMFVLFLLLLMGPALLYARDLFSKRQTKPKVSTKTDDNTDIEYSVLAATGDEVITEEHESETVNVTEGPKSKKKKKKNANKQKRGKKKRK